MSDIHKILSEALKRWRERKSVEKPPAKERIPTTMGSRASKRDQMKEALGSQ